jgi:hypothetical protein
MFTKGYLTTSMPILKDSCAGRHSEFSASPMIPLISHAYLFTDRAGTRRGHHVARPASHAEFGNAEIHICSYLAWRPSLNFMDPGQFPDTKDWVDEFGSAGTKEGGPLPPTAGWLPVPKVGLLNTENLRGTSPRRAFAEIFLRPAP